MLRLFVCRGLLVLSVAILASGCSDESAGGGSPTGPTPPVTTAPPPASGVTNISGNWSGGQFGFQQNGVHSFSNITATITQSDRSVSGSLTFTSPGWEGWHATFTGSLAGNAQESQFVGNFMVQSNSTTGTGICSGQVVFAGRSTFNAMHWEALTMTMVSNVPTQPSTACRGEVLTLVTSLLR